MKRKILGLSAVVLALALSAYTTKPFEKEKKLFNYYWFPLDVASGNPEPSGTLYYQSFDPAGCVFLGFGGYCSGAFTSYTGTGPYYAAGAETVVHVFLFDGVTH